MTHDPTRRTLLKGAAASAALLGSPLAAAAHAAGNETLRIGLIGCGGRGTGAAINAVTASPGLVVTALGDVFQDRLNSSRAHLRDQLGAAMQVTDERCHTGFDAYRAVLAEDVDLVILATPPHFRPEHLTAAVAAGKHVFMEKPVAVDPVGVRKVIAAGEAAASKGLGIVAGTQRRHQPGYLETLKRVHDGAIGEIVSAQCWWDQGGLWVKPRQADWSDMEWQLRNWLYFDWLSGDHIVEQHIHNIDVINWAHDAHPVRVRGMGGRQVRTDPAFGHIFDHFAIEYEYPNGSVGFSTCRQIDNCANRVGEKLVGTKGTATPSGSIRGETNWRFAGSDVNPYEQEHADLVASIRAGQPLNEARRVAESTLSAIMGRLAAYTGQVLEWDEVMASDLDLTPARYALGDLPTPPVALPGQLAS